MPSTTPERHARISRWFGEDHPFGLDGACLHTLMCMGFYEEGGLIRGPTAAHSPTYEQWEMVLFLCEEWDYGFHFEARR